ncbi:MAG: FprA family A-type flavoprotein [Clostridia bacterium]|nr:FprA family A-type flavoprotein [Clostridia bacterium]
MIRLYGCDHIYCVGAEHPDRSLFDCLMPTPHGTTYNSYIIAGEDKTALIDAVDPDKTDVLMMNLREAGVAKLDYLVCLHTEQDHAGSIARVRQEWPDMRVVATAKVRDLLATHVHIPPSAVDVVAEGDVLDLGGRSLRFMPIPFAHWPDNTMAYCEAENVLFSSDLFGSHFALSGARDVSDEVLMEAARSYYSEIMMPFRTQIARYTARVRELSPRIIAPAHGPVWTEPYRILDAYGQWTSGRLARMVTIPYVSMHGSTKVMVDRLAAALEAHGVRVRLHDLGAHPDSLTVETGHMIYDLADSAAIVLATPTVLVGPHPAAVYAAVTTTAMKPPARLFGMIGSYGWGSRAAETIAALTADLKAEKMDPLLVKGLPTEEDLARIDAYASDLANKLDAMEISG